MQTAETQPVAATDVAAPEQNTIDIEQFRKLSLIEQDLVLKNSGMNRADRRRYFKELKKAKKRGAK